jgi:hypothetical protein
LFLYCVGSMTSWLLSEAFMRKTRDAPLSKVVEPGEGAPKLAKAHSLGCKRSFLILLVQIVAVAAAYFLTQAFLFLEPQSSLAQKQVMLWGYRGAYTAGTCENCQDAFALAKAKGLHGVEFDVRFTSDLKMVVMRDGSLRARPTGPGGSVTRAWRTCSSCALS